MEALMIRWRIAAQRWTPGGSEYMDPKCCETFIAERRAEAVKTKIELVKAQRELAELRKAAPTMAEALENLLNHTEGVTLPAAAHVMREKARAALALAKGEDRNG
jgi:hypothetical protein